PPGPKAWRQTSDRLARLTRHSRGKEADLVAIPDSRASGPRDLELAGVEARLEPTRAHGRVLGRQLDAVAARGRGAERVRPEAPGRRPLSLRLHGDERVFRAHADAEGGRGAAAPGDAHHAVGDRPRKPALLHPNGRGREI